jgi:hypothetical protein
MLDHKWLLPCIIQCASYTLVFISYGKTLPKVVSSSDLQPYRSVIKSSLRETINGVLS